MAVEQWDIIVFGAATIPDDDTDTNIGGAEDNSVKYTFEDQASTTTMEVVSESASDTTQTLTVYGRNASGELINEVETLTGTTPVATTATFERLLRVVKSATSVGAVAAMSTSNTRADTAQSAGANYLQLDSGASAVDGFYTGEVLRIPSASGDGAFQVREIVDYNGTDKKAYVRAWTTLPTGTITFEVAPGMVLEHVANPDYEILDCRRPFYNAAAEPASGASRDYYEKIFLHNLNTTTALTTATIDEVDVGLYEKVTFDVEDALDDNDTNGEGNNRQTEGDLSGYSFDSDEKDVSNSQNLSSGSGQGVWLKLTLAAGDSAQNSYYRLQLSGQST